MPRMQVLLFKERHGAIPITQWLDGLPSQIRDKCVARIKRLMDCGYELRRPEAAYLRDGVYELRVRFQRVNYRMLYFFYGNQAVVLTHGLIKERQVPSVEIDKALELKKTYEADPDSHTLEWSS